MTGFAVSTRAKCVVCDGELDGFFVLNTRTREARHPRKCEFLPAGWLSLDAIRSRLDEELSRCGCGDLWTHQGFTCPGPTRQPMG